MAKHDIDPVLQQLAQAINESGQAAAPITVSVHGTVLACGGSAWELLTAGPCELVPRTTRGRSPGYSAIPDRLPTRPLWLPKVTLSCSKQISAVASLALFA